MGWVLLGVVMAAVAGAIAVLRGGGRAGRHSVTVAYPPAVYSPVVYPWRSRAERSEPPHRQLMHYRASGALPRWDP
jgi:hypothetical protein